MTNNNNLRITAQVACEAIINSPEVDFDIDTMNTVLEVALEAGVGDLYTNMVRESIDQAATRRDDRDRI